MTRYLGLFIVGLGLNLNLMAAPNPLTLPPDSINRPTDTLQNPIQLSHPKLYQFFQYHHLDLTEQDNLALYRFVTEWHRAPYRYAGLSKHGVDCSGLVGNAAKEVYGVSLTSGADRIYLECQPLKKSELKEGDLVFFKIASSRISHVGMYLKNNKFVHATINGGVVVSDLNEAYYKRWYFSGGRSQAIIAGAKNKEQQRLLAKLEEQRQQEACATDPETLAETEKKYLNAAAQNAPLLLQDAAQREKACQKTATSTKIKLNMTGSELVE